MPQPRRNIGIESPGFNAAVVKKDEDGWKFLVLQRAASETYGGTWTFITGSKQGKETLAQAVARELKEETGLTDVRLWATEYVVQFYEPENDKIWILPLVVAVAPETAEIALSDENQQFKWLSPEKTRNRVTWKNLVRAVNDLVDELEIYPARNWVEIKP